MVANDTPGPSSGVYLGGHNIALVEEPCWGRKASDPGVSAHHGHLEGAVEPESVPGTLMCCP